MRRSKSLIESQLGNIALAFTHQLDGAVGQVQHRCWRDAAVTAVDDDVDLTQQPASPFLRIIHRIAFVRKLQRAADHWLAQRLQQGLRNDVVRYTDTDGLALFMDDTPWQLLGTFQHKGVRPWREALEHAELTVIDARVSRNLGKIAAHERELMMPVELANTADTFGSVLVAEATSQRVAGIRGISDNGARAQTLRNLRQQTLLRVFRVKFEPIGAHSPL